mmetsp:Transcript_1690/g.1846  ORF Transcript_1690/g.1846 Transcript_1690/m.1846 type:complete len:83 (-) Transcript_1690:329-577(-)
MLCISSMALKASVLTTKWDTSWFRYCDTAHPVEVTCNYLGFALDVAVTFGFGEESFYPFTCIAYIHVLVIRAIEEELLSSDI